MRPLILSEEVIIGLILGRSNLFRDGLIPFVGVRKNRIDIKNDTAKIEQSVPKDLSNLVFRLSRWDSVRQIWNLGSFDNRLSFRGFFAPEQAREALHDVRSLTHDDYVCYSSIQHTRFGQHMTTHNVRDDRKAKRRTGSRNRRKPPLYAAVDLGTNNCRLLIAARRGDSFSVLDSHSQIARLGEGLEATGRLSDASIERAMDALGKISKKLKAKRVGHVRCIATEACRRAENGAAFIQRVRDETGLTFKIIGPEEEARLALIGCHNLIEPDTDRVLVIDIGGGSTELSYVDARPAHEGGLKGLLRKPPILGWRSLPVGVVTLTEAFSHLPEEEAYPQMLAHVMGLIERWKHTPDIRKAFEEGRAHVIGTSGTVTCLTGVSLGLQKYRRDKVDGAWITHDAMMATVNNLREVGQDQIHTFPTIGTDRAGLMLAGCAIVEATWSLAPGGRMRVADRGLREGLLLSMMQGPKKRKRRPRRRSDKPTEPQHESPKEAQS